MLMRDAIQRPEGSAAFSGSLPTYTYRLKLSTYPTGSVCRNYPKVQSEVGGSYLQKLCVTQAAQREVFRPVPVQSVRAHPTTEFSCLSSITRPCSSRSSAAPA